MNKLLPIILLLLGGISTAALSETGAVSALDKQRLQQDMEPWLATKKPYAPPLESQRTPAPDGCQLVHINHLGRHGARHLASIDDYQEDVLEPAIELGLVQESPDHGLMVNLTLPLTEAGQKLADSIVLLNHIYTSPDGQAPGSITDLGVKEQQSLGSHLFQNTDPDPIALKQRVIEKGVTTLSTIAERTRESRDAFLLGLASWVDVTRPDLKVTQFEPERIDRTLRFYDHCKNYLQQSPKIKEKAKTLVKNLRRNASRQTSKQDFASLFISGLQPKQVDKLGELVYKLCRLDANMEYELGACSALPEDPVVVKEFLRTESQYANIKQYYKRGPAVEYLGLNGKMAVELLRDFLTTAQSAMDDDRHPVATLRFAHDATILRMLQILGIVTARNSVNFRVEDEAPMSANIVWQTYRCQESSNEEPAYKVRMLHNERVKPFPVKGCNTTDGMCSWSTVKNHYQNRISGLTLESVCAGLVVQDKVDDE